MSWKPRTTERLAEYIRFIGWSILFLNALMLGLWSVWFVGRFLLQLTRLLARTWFKAPW